MASEGLCLSSPGSLAYGTDRRFLKGTRQGGRGWEETLLGAMGTRCRVSVTFCRVVHWFSELMSPQYIQWFLKGYSRVQSQVSALTWAGSPRRQAEAQGRFPGKATSGRNLELGEDSMSVPEKQEGSHVEGEVCSIESGSGNWRPACGDPARTGRNMGNPDRIPRRVLPFGVQTDSNRMWPSRSPRTAPCQTLGFVTHPPPHCGHPKPGPCGHQLFQAQRPVGGGR